MKRRPPSGRRRTKPRKLSAPSPVRRRPVSSYARARSRPDMKRRTIVIPAAVVVLSLGAMAATGRLGGKKKEGPKAVAVVRGSLVDKALAVGTIEPRIEVTVKSILAGVVRRRFAEVGNYVKRGQPLLEMVELRRYAELRGIELKNVERELTRQQELRNKNLISPADLETAQRQVDESRSQLSLAQ